jgi:3-keto-disaccharide hydrolase
MGIATAAHQRSSAKPLHGITPMTYPIRRIAVSVCAVLFISAAAHADEPAPKAFVDGNGSGWRALGETDFVNVNCDPDTWTWTNGEVHCTGQPVGVIRSKKPYTNFELVAQWRHRRAGGNSGIFVWGSPASLEGLPSGKLPQGIEVQVLDHGFAEAYEKRTGKKADWFTTNGDVFPTGSATMKPFPPVSPDGKRSFPSKNLSRGVDQWNHYYVRAINGEVRLWVNGEEVSGGTDCRPASGYLCLESEGSPVEFRGLRLRELP